MSNQHPLYAAAAARNISTRMSAQLGNRTDVHSRQLLGEVGRLVSSAEALAGVVDAKSPTETNELHMKKVGAAAKTFQAQIAASRDRAHAVVRQGIKDVEQRSRDKTGFKPDSFAAEVRATVRQLSMESKHAVLGDFARKGKGAELAAVIDAPPILTGITDEDAVRYRELLNVSHAPEEHTERTILLDIFGQYFDVTTHLNDVASKLSDPSTLGEIDRGEQAAAAAVAAFNQATQA